MQIPEQLREYIHAHRVPLLAGLTAALCVILVLFIVLCPPSNDCSEESAAIIAPRPTDPRDFLLPPEPPLLPPVLMLGEQDPKLLAERAWTPARDELRTLVEREAQSLVNQLLERAP